MVSNTNQKSISETKHRVKSIPQTQVISHTNNESVYMAITSWCKEIGKTKTALAREIYPSEPGRNNKFENMLSGKQSFPKNVVRKIIEIVTADFAMPAIHAIYFCLNTGNKVELVEQLKGHFQDFDVAWDVFHRYKKQNSIDWNNVEIRKSIDKEIDIKQRELDNQRKISIDKIKKRSAVFDFEEGGYLPTLNTTPTQLFQAACWSHRRPPD